MEDSKQAIKPSFHTSFTSGLTEVEKEKPIDENQQALAHITRFKGWTLLKEYQGRLEEFLDASLSTAISEGATMKEIGERAVIKDLAKSVLRSFISKAEDARRNSEK